MSLLCGILGRADLAVVRRMAHAMKARASSLNTAEGKDYAVGSGEAITAPCCWLDGAPRSEAGNGMTATAFYQHCQDARDPRNLNVTGAFAAALTFEGGRRWWLLRDRLGRKPLYYYQGEDFVLFASELKGILASGLVPKHLNLSSLDRYLTLRCVPGPETIIQGVYRVPPGHVAEYREGELRQTLFAAFDLKDRTMPRDAAAEALREHLRRSLARLDTNPLLWSGGLDCAALAGLRPKLAPLFIHVERGWQSEARIARESARLLSAPLQQFVARRFTEQSFSRAVHALDEPFADASVLPLWLILEEAGKHALSLLSGHGADELLGGYPRYHFLQKTHGARGLVPVSLLGEIAPVLPPNAFIRRGSRYLRSIHDDLQAYLSLISVFDHDERATLYTDVMKAAVYARGGAESAVRHHFIHGDLTKDILSLDLGVGLPDFLLAKCDRLAAAHGVTLEFPYLDDALVDFATALPANTKFGVRSKPVLRMAVKGIVPARVRLRARRDFHIPAEGRLVQVIETLSRQIITQDRVESIGVFKWQFVDQIVRSSTHNIYRRRQFWAVLMFLAWYREVMEP